MLRDPEPARAVGDDHRAVQEALLRNRTPEGAFRCESWTGLGLTLRPGEAGLFQVGHEGFAAGEAPLRAPEAGKGRRWGSLCRACRRAPLR